MNPLKYIETLVKYIDSIESVNLKRLIWSLLIPVFITVLLALLSGFSANFVIVVQSVLILTVLLVLLDVLRARSHELEAVLTQNTEALAENDKLLQTFSDASRSWKDAKPFFEQLCSEIRNIHEEPKHLSIYRGYDHCDLEDHNHIGLRDTIVEAVWKGRINFFNRVFVVTTEQSIDCAVAWLAPFVTEPKITPEIRDSCKFAVAFRRSYNLGSFVALGDTQCFIAIPKLSVANNTKVVAQTECGMFAERAAIANVIHGYTENFINRAWEENDIHSLAFDLKEFVMPGNAFASERLKKQIRDKFDAYDAAAGARKGRDKTRVVSSDFSAKGQPGDAASP